MKATLEFNLDDGEDQRAHLRCVKALDLTLVLYDLDQELRAKTKYAPDSTPQEVYDELVKVRSLLHDLMSDRGLSFDDLII